MKALLVAALALVTISAHAATKQEIEAQAQKAYDGRDYNPAGRVSAQQAANLYGQLAQGEADAPTKAKYMVQQAASSFFLGDSAQDNNEKITQYSNGMAVSLGALKVMGVNDVNNVSDADVQNILKLPKDSITIIAEALYVRGINLGQWGQANGVMQSLDKWPELRTTMELIVKIGAKGLHEYGAYRTLGRGYFKIPALLGGDVAKAQKYLSTCVQGSLAPGQVFSINGYNNLFYADLLKDQGQDDQAKKILTDFVNAAKANPNILPGYAPETREAVRQAVEMLNNW